jgi:uncharacterized iron-regulated membrane protein
VRWIHLVAGLCAGLPLAVAGLTGTVLVYRHELDALLHPKLLRVEPGHERVALDVVVAAARAAAPPAPPALLRLPRSPAEAVEVTTAGADPLQIYVDPYRGTVLGSRRASETLPNLLFRVHTTLLAGAAGERVMGAAALLLLVLLTTGVVAALPARGGGVRWLRDAMAIQRGAGPRRLVFDLHRAPGLWSLGLLAVLALTGTGLVFHEAAAVLLDGITASTPRPTPPLLAGAGGTPLPLDALVGRALREVPGGVATHVTLPASPAAPLVVRLKLPAELHPNGRSFVYLDPRNGEIRAVEHALHAPAGTRLHNLLYPLHIGRWGGPASRIAYALAGLMPLLLLATGLGMWWNRAGRRRRHRAAAGTGAACFLHGAARPAAPLRGGEAAGRKGS